MGNRDLSDRVVYLYTLADPRTDVVRYIGYSVNPKGRLKAHLRETKHCHRTHWIQKLISEGIKPVMEVLEKCLPGEDYKAKEVGWIAAYKAIGFDLVNSVEGGEGTTGYEHTPEWKAENSIRMLGNKHLLGHKPTPEAIEKSRAANIERMSSPEARAEVSKRMLGNKHLLGHKRTPEAIAKTVAVNKGNQYLLGHKHTTETKARIGIASKAVAALRRVQKQMTALVDMAREEKTNDAS